MYNLSEKDIDRLITACKEYKKSTGSDYLFEEYTELIGKLNTYMEQNIQYDEYPN